MDDLSINYFNDEIRGGMSRVKRSRRSVVLRSDDAHVVPVGSNAWDWLAMVAVGGALSGRRCTRKIIMSAVQPPCCP
jgi:hypothetical protein